MENPQLDTPARRRQRFEAQPDQQLTADADAVALAHLSRYDALLPISKTLSGHKTMAELFGVLADSAASNNGSRSGLSLNAEP